MKIVTLAFILTLTLTLSVFKSYSQKETSQLKGKFMVGGTSSFDYKEQDRFGNVKKYLELDFSPDIGYFINNSLVVGLSPTYLMNLDWYESIETGSTTNTLIISPFLRIYLYQGIFTYGKIGVGFSKHSDTQVENEKGNYFNYQLGVGYSYFLKENVSLDIMAGYINNTVETDGSTDKERLLKLHIGFQVYL